MIVIGRDSFKFQKSDQLLFRTHNVTLSVIAMCVCNPDRAGTEKNGASGEISTATEYSTSMDRLFAKLAVTGDAANRESTCDPLSVYLPSIQSLRITLCKARGR